MAEKKQFYLKSTDSINASDLSQFNYCSMAWYLQKCGYEPNSPFLLTGLEKHKSLGKSIDRYEKGIRSSVILKYIGYGLLLFTLFLFILGMVV